MWCTRWYLPLLLLPFPTAPPFFLLVLLFSLTLHARPCLYCIVLLVALFTSSCYWAPTPLDIPSHVLETALPRLLYGPPTPLQSLLNPNTTTTPTNSTTHITYSARLERPKRCWCAPHNMFEPFNITRWEARSSMSVIARRDFWGWLVDEPVEFPPRPPPQPTENEDVAVNATEPETQPTEDVLEEGSASTATSWQSRWATLQERVASYGRSKSPTPAPVPPPQPSPTSTLTPVETDPPRPSPKTEPEPEKEPPSPLPWLRQQYDLRPYGGGIILDFGWGRPKPEGAFNPELAVFKPYRSQDRQRGRT
ncbi:hypothetical protein FRC12_002457 [Ceratobasidium sp. 428]|nr:hypothetical protein FRC12_002457 [Ceratobasidium sp. 428]